MRLLAAAAGSDVVRAVAEVLVAARIAGRRAVPPVTLGVLGLVGAERKHEGVSIRAPQAHRTVDQTYWFAPLQYTAAPLSYPPLHICGARVRNFLSDIFESRGADLVRILSLAVLSNDAAVVGHQETVVVEYLVGTLQGVRLNNFGEYTKRTQSTGRNTRWRFRWLG